jgi:hypothetical protein
VDPAREARHTQLFDLVTDPKEEYPDTTVRNGWVSVPVMKLMDAFEQSLKQYPPIPPGAPDPYTPPTGKRRAGRAAERALPGDHACGHLERRCGRHEA